MSNEPTFTPEPWHIEWPRFDNRATMLKDANEKILCFIGHYPNAKANAYLMKTSPKMYDLLSRMLADWDSNESVDVLAEYAAETEQLLKEARGEVQDA